MGFFKALGYVAAGVGAVVLAPATGGGSLALAIGAMGTTTAAGLAIGATAGAAAAAIDHSVSSKETNYQKGYSHGVEVGTKAGEAKAQEKYEKEIVNLTSKLKSYHDADKKVLALFAVGLAVANCDGDFCVSEKKELNELILGLSNETKNSAFIKTLTQLESSPPSFDKATDIALAAGVTKDMIDSVIDAIVKADGIISSDEKYLMHYWNAFSDQYEAA